MFKQYLVRNKFLCNKAELMLAKCKMNFIRSLLALNILISKETQLILVKDEDGYVRDSLTRNFIINGI